MYNQNYQHALNFIHSRVENSHLAPLHYDPQRFTTHYIQQLLERLGNPQRDYPIIHIAGTKGKGSTAVLIASALQADGYRTGLFTSPYMLDFREQIRIDGELIQAEALVQAIERIRPAAEAIPQLSAFELTVAAAFVSFALQRAEIAVVETGVGGRTDATNVVEPLVSVITSISYDHTNLLGNTLTEIASHKAGIIKPGRPIVSAAQPDEVRAVIRETARAQNSPLIEIGRDICYAQKSHSLDGQTLAVWPCEQPKNTLELEIPLLGAHQLENAALAFAALDCARQDGVEISNEAIQTGFKSTVWPGRFEILRREPPVVLDCAHNLDSVEKLVQTLNEYFPGRAVRLVFGSSVDKDVPGMLALLRPLCKDIFTGQSRHPRAMPQSQLADLAQATGYNVTQAASVADALHLALKAADPTTDLVLVTGSIFVVAEAKERLEASP